MKRSTIRPVSVLAAVALVCSPLAIAGSASGDAHRAASRTGPAHEIRSVYTSELGVARPTGVSWDAQRKALVVTGAAAGGGVKSVSVTPGERLLGSKTVRNAVRPKVPSIRGLSGVTVGAVATNPGNGRRYAASKDGRRLYALSSSGAIVRTHDLSSVGILDLRGMVFAPSSDNTDSPDEQSLYVADRGDASVLGRIAEVSLTEPVVAAATTVNATLVATRETWQWSPPSPDPSGIAYMPGADRFVVSDGEVDEMPIYEGANLFSAQPSGVLNETGTTVPWSNEPTGVAINPTNGHLLVSDDDKKSIFEVASAGDDGWFGTPDDGARTMFKTSTFGNTDPEDVGFDSLRGELLLIDGVGSELFRLNPGPNGVFNGVAPGGDDIATQYDVAQFGAIDPEGVAYDSARDTVVVVDGSSEKIYELDANGSLISTINIASASAIKAAGITIAPASNEPGARHYYVVDRGLDNNSHPTENDGRIFELAASLPTITNRPPAADAGPDLMIDLPDTATLTGSAVDDGKPRGQLTYRWTLLSGPGTVTFGTPQAATTTAKFSALGSYAIRLTVSDGALDDFDDMVVTVHQPGASRTVQIPIVSGADDAMEGGGSTNKFVDLASADVELGNSGPPSNTAMLDGLRFAGIPVPRNGEIVSAKIQFKVDEAGSEAAAYTIRGEANDNAPTYLAVAGNISARPGTMTTVPWSPPAWTLIGDAGPGQLTPDLKTIVQEIVNRPGWVEGNALAFMISGTGRRTAEAKDGLSPPVLVLEFRRLATNTAPVVNAGLDAAIKLPAQAALDGTVTDDGQPQATPTTTWSMVSGPGTVTFGNPALVDTTATFSAPGDYVLRLTASDGLLSTFDDVAVAVEGADAAPVMNAGPDQAIQLPAGATLHGAIVDPGYSGPVTTAWSQVSGPGTVTFGDAAALDTTATFSDAGSYTLRLTGTNSRLSGQDTLVVAVERANAAPVVRAGPDQVIQLPARATLDGTVTDDGQPTPPTVTTTWTMLAGPGTVTFGNAALVDTTAEFSAPGSYTLRLTANDGALSTFDDVQVVVQRDLLSINLQADSDAVVASDEVDLTGRVVRQQDAEPVAGEEVDVWVTRAPGASPVLLGTVVTRADGGFALTDQPLVNSTYQAKAGEDASEAEAVLVSPRATARTARPSVMVGQRSRLGGVVEPGVTGQPVRLQRWNGSGWATIAQKSLAAGSTRYWFDLPTGRSRRTSYRVFVPAYAGRSQTTTAPVVVDVYRVRINAVNTAREYVTLENTGHTNADLRGWTLTNPGSGITRVLPAFTLRPGRSVRIHSGSGINDWNDVYLGRRAMWGTHGTAVVRNIQRFRIDKFSF
jgi:hypothetical protein